MGIKEPECLINCVYLGHAHQTDGLHFRAVGDFLKVNLINNEQCHINAWGKEVAGGCEGGMKLSIGCPLGAEWCNLVRYCNTATRGFNYLPWIKHNVQERKSVFWCISMVGRFIAWLYCYQQLHCVNCSLWDTIHSTHCIYSKNSFSRYSIGHKCPPLLFVCLS